MSNQHIVVVGSINMDLVVRVQRIPPPGETVIGGVFATFPGGKGANQAVAAARLGARVTMIGCVGADAFGSQLVDLLEREGIDASHVRVDSQAATGVALIEVDAGGQNSIAVASGANLALTGEDVRRIIGEITAFDMLIMPMETTLESVQEAARLAHERKVKVILNPAPAQKLPEGLLELVDVIVPNEFEAATITGVEPADESSIQAAAEVLRQRGAGSVILTLGSRGAYVVEGQGSGEFIPAYRVKAVDSTAAGDCFVGGLAVAWGEGKCLSEAARFASAAAAISVTRPGAQPSLPGRREVEEFLAAHTPADK